MAERIPYSPDSVPEKPYRVVTSDGAELTNIHYIIDNVFGPSVVGLCEGRITITPVEMVFFELIDGKKKVGWVNVYYNDQPGVNVCGQYIYKSQEEAEMYGKTHPLGRYVASVKLEWEEPQ